MRLRKKSKGQKVTLQDWNDVVDEITRLRKIKGGGNVRVESTPAGISIIGGGGGVGTTLCALTNVGPNGEANYTGYRYWVRQVEYIGMGAGAWGQPAEVPRFGLVQNGLWIAAVNTFEQFYSAAAAHQLPDGGYEVGSPPYVLGTKFVMVSSVGDFYYFTYDPNVWI